MIIYARSEPATPSQPKLHRTVGIINGITVITIGHLGMWNVN